MDAQWLQAKTAGLPRWAWVTLFGGAVIVGLYIRSRNTESEEDLEGLEEPEPEEAGLSQYDGTETAGGLGSVGIAGPAGGQLVPVEAPFIPDALTDSITALTGSNIEGQQALAQIASDALNREPNERVEVIHERDASESDQGITGGGAPKRKPHHKPPKKHQKKQQQPRQKKQRQKKQPRTRGGAKGKRNAPHNTGRRGSGHRAR